jgi:hypothetical protein
MSSNDGNPAPTNKIIIMYQKIKKKKRIENKLFTFFCWLFTLAIWIFIVLLITINKKKKITKDINDFYKVFENHQKKKKLKITYSIAFSLVYIIYLITEFCSLTLKYLFNKEREKTLVEKMKSLFNKIPYFKLKTNIKHKKRYMTNNYKYKIISCRDISGNFILNIYDNNKKFIFLKLKLEITFDDEETSINYFNQKEKFIKDNEEEDNFEIKEEIKIKEMNKYNLIKIYDDDSKLVNHYMFILLTFLTFVEFYKIYLNYISIVDEFIIRKVISLRNDLSQCQEYNKSTPKEIKIIKNRCNNYIVNLKNEDKNKNNGNNNNNNSKVNNDNMKKYNINKDNITKNAANIENKRKIDSQNTEVNITSKNPYKSD